MKGLKPKKIYPLECRTFQGDSGRRYLVFSTPGRRTYFHVFVEVEAKQAAQDCRSRYRPTVHTQIQWKTLWDLAQQRDRG